MDKTNWSPIALPSSIKLLASLVEETIALLRQRISTNVEQNLRHDYQELAVTIRIFLNTIKANTNNAVKAANTRDAPSNDLELLRKLTKAQVYIQTSAKSWPSLLLLLVKKARGKNLKIILLH